MSQSPPLAEAPPAHPDYYAILGLPANGGRFDVGRAYWQLARKYHALAPGEPLASVMLDQLNEAAQVLGTPARRLHYDALRREALAPDPLADTFVAALGRRAAKLKQFGLFVVLVAVAALASSPAIARARPYNMKALPGASVTSAPVVFLGDSVTGGAGASFDSGGFASLLRQRLDGAGFAAGTGGYDSVISALGGQLVDLRFSQDIGRQPRSLIVVEVGAHSVVEDPVLSLRDYGTGYGLMLDCLQGTGATVVVSTVPWLGWDRTGPQYATAQARSKIIRDEAGRRGIPVADLWNAMKDRRDLLASDGFHPNDAGHRMIADLYWLQIQPFLSRPPGAFLQRCDYDRVLAFRSLQLDATAPLPRGS